MKRHQTPWHPDLQCVRRVKHPLPAPTRCHHCCSLVQVKHHSEVYRTVHSQWPWMYRCSGCNASVGMHPKTNIPLGSLATREVSKARVLAKTEFEKLYRSGVIDREYAYFLLSQTMGIARSQCHFGMFDELQCSKASQAVSVIYEQLLIAEFSGKYSCAA